MEVKSLTPYLVQSPYKHLVAQALQLIGRLSSMLEMPKSTLFMRVQQLFKV